MCDSKINNSTVPYSSNKFSYNNKFSNNKLSWRVCVCVCVNWCHVAAETCLPALSCVVPSPQLLAIVL